MLDINELDLNEISALEEPHSVKNLLKIFDTFNVSQSSTIGLFGRYNDLTKSIEIRSDKHTIIIHYLFNDDALIYMLSDIQITYHYK